MPKQEENVSASFKKLSKKCQSLGITPDQLATLPSYKTLLNDSSYSKFMPTWVRNNNIHLKLCKTKGKLSDKWMTFVQWMKKILSLRNFALFLSIIFLLLAFLFATWSSSSRYLLEKYFKYYGMDIDRDLCVLQIPEDVVEFARPPVDCSICKDMKSVDRVSSLSPREFEEKYAYTAVPVVITDGMKNWTAQEHFSFEFFKNLYMEDSKTLDNFEEGCQFFPYKTDFRSLGEVLNMSKERAELKDGSKPWYIGWSNCDPYAANILRKYYQRPYFLPKDSESSVTDWLFMGSPNYGAHMHIDAVQNPSWQAQIKGTKLWVLEPPPECYHVCQLHTEVTVHPGEIIVLDTNQWYHSTLILGDEMSITIGSEYD